MELMTERRKWMDVVKYIVAVYGICGVVWCEGRLAAAFLLVRGSVTRGRAVQCVAEGGV